MIAASFEARFEASLEVMDDVQWEEEEKAYQAFSQRRFELSIMLKRRAAALSVAMPTQPRPPGVNNSTSNIRLPEIPLPKFDGTLESWPAFRDAFVSMIEGHHGLSEVDKLTYLKRVVSKEAAQVIETVDNTAANYSVAWELLKERYENEKVFVRRYLDELFSLPHVKRESFEALTILLDGFERTLKMVEKIDVSTKGWSILLAHILCNKLDGNTLKLWESRHRSTEVAEYKELSQFLREHCKVLQALPHIKANSSDSSKPLWRHACATVSVSVKRCVFFKQENHSPFKCHKFRKMAVIQRYEIVKEKRLCINCLAVDHMVKECPASVCRVCKLKHHTMLHRSASEPRQMSNVVDTTTTAASMQSNEADNVVEEFEPVNAVMVAPAEVQRTAVTTSVVLLPTALVTVVAATGNRMVARALLDGGAQVNLITERLVQRLQAPKQREHQPIGGVGKANQASSSSVNVVLNSRCSNFDYSLRYYVLPEIMWNLPQANVERNKLKLPNNIILADPTCGEIGPIDMLLGREVFNDLLQDGIIRISSDEIKVTLQQTRLGWIVSGTAPIEHTSQIRAVNLACCRLDEQLSKFWEIEACHVKSKLSPLESHCEALFESSTTREKDGRFTVLLPKDPAKLQQLGSSFDIAKRRLDSLSRRLNANPAQKRQYQQFLDEYLQMGHMEEKRSSSKDCGQVYYMPHHCIVRPDSLTTKLRVVFDASCSTDSGDSLNDALIVGPVVQDDLVSITLRFRLPKYALIADIEKMYRQIWVQKSERPLQRILWKNDSDGDIKIFQLNTVTYGTSSAPYLATKCLKMLAQQGKATYPVASKVLANDFYMDDMITGVETIAEGKILAGILESLDALLKSAGFLLRKWASNATEILEVLPPSAQEQNVVLCLDSNDCTTALGLKWTPATDQLGFSVPNWNETMPITKRKVLSESARLYDPIGLIGPVVVLAKCFMQELWSKKISWDEPLPDELQNRWNQFKENLAKVGEITVPRRVITDKAIRIEVHWFSDASLKAYGACIYLRSIGADGSSKADLLCVVV
uniref:DUF1758 domain-containing protein n=1 Tax=Anopheles dirus TaxID=7168 RepID=A0A182NVM4_9DIPT